MKREGRHRAASFASLLAVLLLTTTAARAADEKSPDAIDWNRARQLRQRSQSGEALTDEEQAYLKRAEAAWPTRSRPSAVKLPSAAAKPSGSREAADANKVTRPAIDVEACPVEALTASTSDGQKVILPLRKPPGKGPFPALIHLHGGLGTRTLAALKQELLDVQTHCYFLAAGYIVVNPTFRSREKDPQTRDALVDCLAVIDWVKKMPEVDPKSVVLWGDSGGGSLVLELAGETSLCAVTAQEPATVLLTGMLSLANLPQPGSPGYQEKWQAGSEPIRAMMANPQHYYTPELRKFTEEKIRKINCPVLIAEGDQHPIKKLNNEIIIPAMKAAGKQVEVIVYPGERHGFSYRGTPTMTRKFFEDSDAFFRRHMPTQPKPLARTLITETPVE